ncbi:DNA polymerase III subunit beta [Thiospirochaeta perfilievii]|uniref:Beta sliding clamp n=1 Tax=Thiospirochaeta perfilievii TaxID=252967 RepID=A0A5C1QEY1_9SPIO|nr:DNA polymerase III subunit beta [Thiospirochaeta perfilievii]QEN04782.1 DNA polymerase III subunit beta [Thiospirochaeta perfilievii]
MKFTCNKSILLKEILIAQDIISGRNALSILSNVLLEVGHNKLTIKATDLKVNFETKIPVQVIESGKTTVFCDKFLNIIRNLPESEVEFEKNDDNILTIKPIGQHIDFKLRCIPSDNFPEIVNVSNDNYFELPLFEYNQMINHTIFAVSDDETRYFLNGVFFEKSGDKPLMVATDGRRLSYIDSAIPYEINDFEGVIIPIKILNLIKKLSNGEGNISIAIVDKTIHVKLDNQKISSSLIEGQFPQYSRITTEVPEKKAIIDRNKFMTAIKRVSLLAESRSRRIFVTLEDNKVTLLSEESDIGNAKEEFDCEYEGPKTVIALNYLYLLEPLKSIEDENIEFCFTDEARPVMIYSSPKSNFLHMIQPMQVD